MSRKQSDFDFFVDAASLIPWWANIILALFFYLVLHHYATLPAPAVTTAAQLGTVVKLSMGKTAASFGQVLIPAIFLLGAVVSVVKKRQRDQLMNQAKDGTSPAVLNDMSWKEFEVLVGEAFRRRGYSVADNAGSGPDGGVDLVLKKDGELFLVQCKQWRAFTVNVNTVRELYGVMVSRGASGGFVVTSGSFTAPAKEFASGKNIELIDGRSLHAMIQDLPSPTKSSAGGGPQLAAASSLTPVPPSCPVCNTPMVKRTSRQNIGSGSEFWGCPKFPKCRGTRSITSSLKIIDGLKP